MSALLETQEVKINSPFRSSSASNSASGKVSVALEGTYSGFPEVPGGTP